ncbi:MAG: hypothetical protein ACJ8C4_10565 [Gemmataceae bacterium]
MQLFRRTLFWSDRVFDQGASVHPQFPGHKPISLNEFLDHKMLSLNGRSFSVAEVIDCFANKNGGAHYSPSIPPEFANSLVFGDVKGVNFFAWVLLEIARAVLRVGHHLFSSLLDWELHFDFAVPVLPANRAVLFEASIPETRIKWGLFMDRCGKLEFQAVGAQGNSVTMTSDRTMNLAEPRYLRLTMTLDESFSTFAEMSIDKVRVARAVITQPLFVTSDLLPYDFCVNRSCTSEPQAFSFAMRGVWFNSRDMWETEFQTQAHTKQDRSAEWRLFQPLSFMRSLPDERLLKPSGNITVSPMSELFQNCVDGTGAPSV